MDAVVIGGGFYGCNIALALRSLGMERVTVVEREKAIMRRASYVNQARVHNGYHYPRSLPTAISSRQNFRTFLDEYPFAVVPNAKMVYGIASDSRVTASQFQRFCDEIGAPCREDRRALDELFDPTLMEACFAVDEIAFDTTQIARDLARRLTDASITCHYQTEARVVRADDIGVELDTTAGPMTSRYVFNCTYAHLDGVGVRMRAGIKRELTEIALIKPPRSLDGRAITVMDGPYFSTMPFPALDCYSLTHVRYTPHTSSTEAGWVGSGPVEARGWAMLRDAARFMPSIGSSTYLGSLYEIKTILVRSEDTDSRPIVFEQAEDSERVYSVLGSKLDNVYDILSLLRQKKWN